MNYKVLIFIAHLILFSINTAGQSGGKFEITESVVASGGGQQSADGIFSLEAAIGQPLTGNASSGSPFTLTSGFWNFTPLAPTAAGVTVGGRVLTADGRGITKVWIIITDRTGAVRTTQTSSFGYYRFNGVEVGETYIFTVSARRFTFSQPTQIRAVFEEMIDIDFIAN